MPALVVSSAALPIDLRPHLPQEITLRVPEDGSFPRAALLAELAGADALISLLDVRVDDELLAAAPRLRIVANCAVGYDNVDVPAATRRGVVVTNTPDVLTDATADLAFALLLAAARRLGEGEALIRSGAWQGWAPGQLLGQAIAGRTLGIIGLGRIGQAVARRARGFDMEILYSGPREVAAAGPLGARRVPLEELLGAADAVTLHCPLTPETRHIIDAAALARMKRTAILVNTSRGPCVDEEALADALERGVIAGAGLDVFEREPEVHPRLLASRRAVLLPHLGSATLAARGGMARLCAEAVSAVLAGRRPAHPVNPEVLS
ncbi:MAG TPA: D-glycerate dehydrogenase [Kofleriaceae bacterium]|nr:D-glycerate dehydrogenase [Kofleriaceae bacterium]